jgi:hypothetical protein
MAFPFFLATTTLSSTINEVIHPHCRWNLLTSVVVRLAYRRVQISPLELIVIVVARLAAALTLGSALVIEHHAPTPIAPFTLDAEFTAAAPLVFLL